MMLAGASAAALAAWQPSLAAAAPASCAVPKALQAAGETASARQEYIALLKKHPNLDCAVTGLASLRAPTPTPTPTPSAAVEAQRLCDRGAAYLALHRDADALAAYKAALEKDLTQACARKGVASAGPGWPRRTADTIRDAVPTFLIAAALVAALVLGLFFVVLLLGYIKPIYGWLVQRRPFRSILSPRLTLEPLGDNSEQSVSATIDARIKERMARIPDEVRHADAMEFELDFGTPRESFSVAIGGNDGLKSALENASEAADQTRFIGALVNLLYVILPVRRLTVAGVVEAPAANSAAATLMLENNGTLVASHTICGTPDPDRTTPSRADYVALADPAAVWVQYEVARAVEGGNDLGVHDAESYSLVREGLALQFTGDPREAHRLYERAVELADTNWAAQLNLAMNEARVRGDYPRAVEILSNAATAMESTDGYLGDPNYYRLGYQLAAQQLNQALGAASGETLRRAAVETATRLLRTIGDRLDRSAGTRGEANQVRLDAFLRRTVRPCGELVLAAALADSRGGEPEATERAERVLEAADRGEVSYRVHYAIACWYARPSTHVDDQRAFGELEIALGRAPRDARHELAEWCVRDPALALLRQRMDEANFRARVERYRRQEPRVVEPAVPKHLRDLLEGGTTDEFAVLACALATEDQDAEDQFVQTVAGLLNTRGGTLLLGAIESGSSARWGDDDVATADSVGTWRLVGVGAELDATGWDGYVARLRKMIDDRIAPAPGAHVEIKHAMASGRVLAEITVTKAPKDTYVRTDGQADAFWGREDDKNQRFEGAQIGEFQERLKARSAPGEPAPAGT
jgi:tetratricopeptide (TPR) repeat protein